MEGIVAVNLNQYNGTGKRGSIRFNLAPGSNGAAVRRLTAPSGTSKPDITWAGQHLSDNSGFVLGKKTVEKPKNGEVIVQDSEEVLVSFL